MLVRCGVAACILAICAVALAALGGTDLSGLRSGAFAVLLVAALVFVAGEAKTRTLGLSSRRSGRTRRALPSSVTRSETGKPPPAVDDLVRMLDDTLKLARPVPAVERLEPVDVTSLLGVLANRPDGARLELQARRAPIHTLASRPALARAFDILIDNAVSNGSRTAVSFDSGASALAVHVDDNGPGVPCGERGRVFEWRYYMSTPPSEQVGCRADLVIARQILRVHGGDLVVGPSPLGGARFTARLPLIPDHELQLAAAS